MFVASTLVFLCFFLCVSVAVQHFAQSDFDWARRNKNEQHVIKIHGTYPKTTAICKGALTKM